MKKIFLGLGVVALLGVTASCKKNHTCECVESVTIAGNTTTDDQPEVTTIKDTKKKAKKACEAKSSTQTGVVIPPLTATTTITCTLK